MTRALVTWLLLALAALLSQMTSAYTVPLSSLDVTHQACSGMWGPTQSAPPPCIDLTFDQGEGQLALVIYEWTDVGYLGVDNPALMTAEAETYGYVPRTYICTTDALRQNLCLASELGEFIVRPPRAAAAVGDDEDDEGQVGSAQPPPREETSIFTEGLRFVGGSTAGAGADDERRKGVRGRQAVDDDDDDDDSSNSSRTASSSSKAAAAQPTSTTPTSPSSAQGDPAVDEPAAGTVASYVVGSGQVVRYNVTRTGYYCVGVVPVTLLPPTSSSSSSIPAAAQHGSFTGHLVFHNVFPGHLPAADHPKLAWYLLLTTVYALVGLGWAGLCWRFRRELLPIQHYIGLTLGYLTLELLLTFVYYRWLDARGPGRAATALLVVVSVLNAGRNSGSFFLLLVVSMGLSVVTPTLPPSILRKVQLLALVHFAFGLIYAVGSVAVELESTSLLGLLAIGLGLSVSLTTFLMWTAVSLNGTILHLEKRKQHAKLRMFQLLHRILMGAVCAVAAFFVLSAVALSDRSSDDFAPRNWQYRWFLLDGSLSTIYAVVCFGIAWLWRPTGRNVRLAMSEELAQDEAEADAEDYELAQHRRRRGSGASDEDDDDDDDDDLEAARPPGLARPDPPPGYDVPSSTSPSAAAAAARQQAFAARDAREHVVFAIDDDEEEEEGEDEDDDDDDDDDEGDARAGGESKRRAAAAAADDEDEGEADALVGKAGGGSSSSSSGSRRG